MKKKLLGIFVCMLLIATALPAVGTIVEPEPSEMQVVTITRPVAGNLYLFDTIVIPIGGSTPIIIRQITFQAQAQPNVAYVLWGITDVNGNDITPIDMVPVYPPNFPYLWVFLHLPFPPFLPLQFNIYVNAFDSSNNFLGTQSILAFKIF